MRSPIEGHCGSAQSDVIPAKAGTSNHRRRRLLDRPPSRAMTAHEGRRRPEGQASLGRATIGALRPRTGRTNEKALEGLAEKRARPGINSWRYFDEDNSRGAHGRAYRMCRART